MCTVVWSLTFSVLRASKLNCTPARVQLNVFLVQVWKICSSYDLVETLLILLILSSLATVDPVTTLGIKP